MICVRLRDSITGTDKTRNKLRVDYIGLSVPDSDAPAAVGDLTAVANNSSSVTLSFTAPGDDGDSGSATSYAIRRSTAPISEANWSSASLIGGVPAPQPAGASESIVASGLSPDTLYYFGLKASDEVGNTSALSNIASAQTAAPDRTLSYSQSGSAAGSVVSNPPGIDCSANCAASFADGSSVTLTATPSAGAMFIGWSGNAGCSGSGPCTLLMDSDQQVTATFEPGRTLSLSVSGTGSGVVSSSPAGIDCSTNCSAGFANDSSVLLTPLAAAGSSFVAWGGDCSGFSSLQPCSLSMSADKSASAIFDGQPTLSISSVGEGLIKWGYYNTAEANYSTCGSSCVLAFNPGVLIHLKAYPASPEFGFDFSGWNGPCTPAGNKCEIRMDGSYNVTATFTEGYPVAAVGAGAGRIVNAAGTDVCVSGQPDCFLHGSGSATLVASANIGYGRDLSYSDFLPSSNSLFTGWAGACSGTGSCTVDLANPGSVSAQFIPSLRVEVTGNGRVTSTPSGIDCGATCAAAFNANTMVELLPLAPPGSRFSHWLGACSGSGPCWVANSAGRWVDAHFVDDASASLHIATSGSGQGYVRDATGTFSCGQVAGSNCAPSFSSAALVDLTANPLPGSSFVEWSGACSGNTTCTVSMSAAHSVTARFAATSSARVVVTLSGPGEGSVRSDPPGIDCGTPQGFGVFRRNCSASFAPGAQVTLTATAARPTGSNRTRFDGWAGVCSGTEACQLTVSEGQLVTAVFGKTESRSLTKYGDGSLSSVPDGLSCGPTCSTAIGDFAAGTDVVLLSKAEPGAHFQGWRWVRSWLNNGCLYYSGSFWANFFDTAPVFPYPHTFPCGGNFQGSPGGDWTVSAAFVADAGFSIEGTLGVSAARLRAVKGTTIVDAYSDVHGNYRVTVPYLPDGTQGSPSSWTLTPSKSGCSFINSQQSVTLSPSTQQATVDFAANCSTAPRSFSGAAGWPGITLTATASSAATQLALSDAAGDFALALDAAVFTLTPSRSGCSFSPSSLIVDTSAGDPPPITFSANCASHPLQVTIDGSGAGSVSSEPAAIACGDLCSAMFAPSSTVTLEASAAPGAIFAGWSGACAGQSDCTLAMEDARAVTATFTVAADFSVPEVHVARAAFPGSDLLPTLTLHNHGATVVAGDLRSRIVLSNDASYSVDDTTLGEFVVYASGSYKPKGGQSTYVAPPSGNAVVPSAAGEYYLFVVTDSDDRHLEIDETNNVSAPYPVTVGSAGLTVRNYARCPTSQTDSLNPSCSGWFDGSVVSTPGLAGYSGGVVLAGYGSKSAAFLPGSTVQFAASPDAQGAVRSWSGCASISGNICSAIVPASGLAVVEVRYGPADYQLSVNPAGNGSGTVQADLGPLSNGGTFGAPWVGRFFAGKVVNLSASATPGSTFAGWSNGCSGRDVCSVTIDAARSVTASFGVGHLLSVQHSGLGSGSVSSADGGIDCGTVCDAVYDGAVSLSASAAPGSQFAGWSGGGCSGFGPCSATIDAATTVSAQFDLDSPSLTLAVNGPGAVDSAPDGGHCSGNCVIDYGVGTQVTLVAVADADAQFQGWSGACSGTADCVLNLDQDLSVAASFVTLRQLTLTRSGPGDGRVTSAPAGIDCGVDCVAAFADGTSVTLTAVAGAGANFTGWSGGGCSGTDPCTLVLQADSGVDAGFDGYADPPYVVVPALPPPPEPNPEGEFIGDDRVLVRGANLVLLRDYNPAPSPMTAQTKCALLVTNCVRGDIGSLDSCVMSAPRCTTSTPWNEEACCADACWNEYRTARIGGSDDLSAMLDVLFDAPSCMPGVDDLVWGYAALPRVQRNELLDAHNSTRSRHCSAALTWSNDLAAAAQRWADQISSNDCQLAHSPEAIAGQYGENLAWAGSSAASAAELVGDWSAESALYDFGNPVFASETAHFTAMVWRATSEVGCGIAVCPGGEQALVCNYLETPNVSGQFADNVLAEPVPPEVCAP